MRLLEIDQDAQCLTFTKDLSDKFPPYAILSHTWGDDEEEITYKDIKKGRGRNREGFRKIEFCVKQATLDGLKYLWIDTCCIDKANSTELTEAVNSMYRWYQNSTKCYVYLTDVSKSNPVRDSWEEDFRQTRWATRGWTLQELLAPSAVEFFSSEGSRLGDKRSLEALLREMTQIPANALRGDPCNEFTELERMSWMAKRQTNRPEDLAYALLGIFDVQMPLIYGEGEQSAFIRLREAIQLQLGRTKLVKSSPEPCIVVPFGRNPDFVGRKDTLEQLVQAIIPGSHDRSCPVTVIEGLGGIGKTQIALEAAYQVHVKTPACSIFWVPAVDRVTIENAFRKIGHALKIPKIDGDQADVKLMVKDALGKEDAGQWLLVIDNADDMDLMFGNEEQPCLADYLPFSRNGSILFTTRNHEVTVGMDVARGRIFSIMEMDLDEGMQLLRKKLTEAQLCDVDSTQKLLQILSCLPLALRQASAFMSRTGMTTLAYLELCESSDAAEIEILSQHFEDRSRYRHEKCTNPIATTWLISFRHITEKYPLAAQYLKYICYLAEKDIPVSLLPKFGSEMANNIAVGVLKNYAFINARDESDSFDIHRLVRLAVRNWTKHTEHHLIREVIEHLSSIYPQPSSENKNVWLRYLSHVDSALDTWMRNKYSDAGWRLLVETGESHFILGKAQTAEIKYRQASSMSERALGLDHQNTIYSNDRLSKSLRQQAKYEAAEQLQRQILQSSVSALGPKHPSTLAIRNGLAEVLRQSGRYHQAEPEQKLNFQYCIEVLGQNHANTLASLNNLIIINYQRGDYHQAKKQCQFLVRKRTELLGNRHLGILSSLNSLAIILDQQGEYAESEEQHRENLRLATEIWGKEHPETMATVTNLASVLYRQGKFLESEKQHEWAMEAITRELSDDHPDTLANTNGLAELLREEGRYQEAEAQHHRTLKLITKILGPEHPSTLAVMTNLAATLLQSGNCVEAAALYQRTLSLKTRILGPEHPSTIVSMDGIATVFLYRKRYHEAECYYQQIADLRQKVLGLHHALLRSTLNKLAISRHLRRSFSDSTATSNSSTSIA